MRVKGHAREGSTGVQSDGIAWQGSRGVHSPGRRVCTVKVEMRVVSVERRARQGIKGAHGTLCAWCGSSSVQSEDPKESIARIVCGKDGWVCTAKGVHSDRTPTY